MSRSSVQSDAPYAAHEDGASINPEAYTGRSTDPGLEPQPMPIIDDFDHHDMRDS